MFTSYMHCVHLTELQPSQVEEGTNVEVGEEETMRMRMRGA